MKIMDAVKNNQFMPTIYTSDHTCSKYYLLKILHYLPCHNYAVHFINILRHHKWLGTCQQAWWIETFSRKHGMVISHTLFYKFRQEKTERSTRPPPPPPADKNSSLKNSLKQYDMQIGQEISILFIPPFKQ